MFYHAASNQYIIEGQGFQIGGTSYPSNWLNCTSPAEKAALGLVEVTNSNQPEDERFYWVSSSLSGAVRTYTNTPKDLDALKKQWSNQIAASVHSMLLRTDYMDSRKNNDPAYNPPQEWLAWRADVRKIAAEARKNIATAVNVEQLKTAVQVQWPESPSE